MWMKTMKALRTAARWIELVLEARLPMAASYGLKIR